MYARHGRDVNDFSLHEMSLVTAKVASALILLVGTFACGNLPMLFRIFLLRLPNADQRSRKFLSFLLCFGGGVLFATSFIHMLPEVRENFERYWDHFKAKDGHGFPLPEFVVCSGFLLVYLIEEMLHAALGHVKCPGDAEPLHGHQHTPADLTCSQRDLQVPNGEAGPLYVEGANTKYGSTDNSAECSDRHRSGSTFHGLLVVAALSFHSLFEGMAIGLQSTVGEVWALFFAIAVHKFVIAFVIGLEILSDSRSPRVLAAYLAVFSVMSPLGLTLAVVTDISGVYASDVLQGVLTGLATGTLLYVTFFEVLQREKHCTLPGLLQLTAVLLGFGVMTGAQILGSL